MPAAPVRVGIALCGELGSSLDLDVLRAKLEKLEPDTEVEVVPDLCRQPAHAHQLAAQGAERLVFGLCDRPPAPHEFQAQVRKAGLDPFAAELVPLGHAARRGNATALLIAAAARLRALDASGPEQLRLELLPIEGKRSRRSLLTVPPTTYSPVAAVFASRCFGERCSLCVPSCPVGAIKTSAGFPVVDRYRCDGCGLCISACPMDAIACPGSSLSQYEAEIEALLAAEHPALAFACREGDQSALLDAGWLPVGVPCAGMVTPGWILQALAGGAESVGVLCCDECRPGQASGLAERVEYVRALLRLLGESEPDARVGVLDGALRGPARGARRPGRARGSLTLVEPRATAEAALILAGVYGGGEGHLAHECSPLGLIALRAEACTACGACATACPTGALVVDERADGTAVSFDPARCVGCGRCVSACPEAEGEALRVGRITDLRALARGRTVLKRDAVVLCRRCQGPVAPRAMLDRIGELLRGDERADVLVEALTGLCPDCRGLGEPLAAGRSEP